MNGWMIYLLIALVITAVIAVRCKIKKRAFAETAFFTVVPVMFAVLFLILSIRYDYDIQLVKKYADMDNIEAVTVEDTHGFGEYLCVYYRKQGKLVKERDEIDILLAVKYDDTETITCDKTPWHIMLIVPERYKSSLIPTGKPCGVA